ncbi:MAG: uracil-DNA glycosylase [Treponema sp.]|jgi:DNA polymerase|nr:uracil-DNA glycosylase [Treponema sp.]
MTAAEKQKLSCFLDLAGDYFSCGYKITQRDYRFEDDQSALQAAPEITENDSGDSLEKIAREIGVCANCYLAANRTNTVPGEGVTEPLVMVIGEGPGADEDAQGRPFVGKAGQLLDKMLASISLSRNSNCFIANMVKCRPPGNRNPYPEETAACVHFLHRQIKLLKPKFILCAGNVSAQAMLNTTERVGKLHGTFTDIETGGLTIPLFVTYHPSALLHSAEYKRPAWEDLKRLRARLDGQS